jgi:hemin uptake protein HemP
MATQLVSPSSWKQILKMNKNDPKINAAWGDASANGPAKIYSSLDLFGASNSVIINHYGVCYILRITQLGKLILTK